MDDYQDRYDNILGINRNPSLGEHKCEALFLREDQSCDQTKDVKRRNLSYFGLGGVPLPKSYVDVPAGPLDFNFLYQHVSIRANFPE